MSVKSALDFSTAVLSNPALFSEVSTIISGKSPEEASADVAAFGKTLGYDFTSEEAEAARRQLLGAAALSEEELEHVAGGAIGNQNGSAGSAPTQSSTSGTPSNNSGGYQETYLTQSGSLAAGAMMPGGGIIGAGVGAGINAALNGASTNDSIAAGAYAANDQLNNAKSTATSW